MRKIIFCKQRDSIDCGAACLQMICFYYGKKYSLEELIKLCCPTEIGVSLYEMNRAAGLIGIDAFSGYADIDELKTLKLPCVIHWNQNHFVVLHKIVKRFGKYYFYIADPGCGMLKYSFEDFVAGWATSSADKKINGIVMLFTPTGVFYSTQCELINNKRTFKFLFRYFKQYKYYFAQVILGLAIGTLIELLFPLLTQSIVDVGIKFHDEDVIFLILVGELVLTISRVLIDYIRRWLLLHIGMYVNISLVFDFLSKLLRLPMYYFDTKKVGDLMQRISDHGRIQNFLTGQLLSVLFSIITFMVFVIMLFFYNYLIFIVFMLFSIIYGIWVIAFLNKRKAIDYKLFGKQSQNQDKIIQLLKSMQEIKLQCCEVRRCKEWENIQLEMFKVQLESLKLGQTQVVGGTFINEFKNVLITVLAATAVIHGSMTLGMMLAVQYIIGQLASPIDQLMNFIYSLQDVKIGLERINEVHVKEDEDSAKNNLVSFTSYDHSILVKHVDFSYNRDSHCKILDDINLNIPRGKVTAIVGESGSGKTTLLKLLLGYYPVDSGEILISGTNIFKYNLRWWRSQCGVVMQEGVIFSESIELNIAVGDSDIDFQRLHEAATLANIDEYIESLPLKYKTLIGPEGVGLSMGQRQRILIARAVYKNPDFIFLDEATNSLDANNEKTIVEDLSKFYAGRTVLIIAHRLSTVRSADNIVVFEKGKIVEMGSHEMLINQKGAYYKLVKNQLEL